MDFDTRVKTAIYRWVAETTRVPSAAELAEAIREKPDDIREAYRRPLARFPGSKASPFR
jgi:hypothetical protein